MQKAHTEPLLLAEQRLHCAYQVRCGEVCREHTQCVRMGVLAVQLKEHYIQISVAYVGKMERLIVTIPCCMSVAGQDRVPEEAT